MDGDQPSTELLLVGATGFVGAHLLAGLAGSHDVTAVRHSSAPLPGAARWVPAPEGPGGLRDLVLGLAPRFVVNAAALASIDGCERDPEAARNANVLLPEALARGAADVGARIVHLSTDQVFDGARGLYREEDPPCPISVYGRTKAEGEERVLAAATDAVVARLNLLFGRSRTDRPSGTERLIAAARAGEDLPFFTDEFRSPLAVTDAAAAIGEILGLDHRGILHLGGPDRLSRFDLGRAILERVGLGDRARPASSSEHRGPPRAPDTSFDTTLAQGLLSAPPRPLAKAIDSVD